MSSFLNSRRDGFRALCWLMTILTAIGPSMPTLAQDQAEPNNHKTLLADPATVSAEHQVQPLKLQYLAPGTAAVIAARPQQLLTCEAAEMLPIEVVSAASLKELGFDPVNATQIVVSVSPPLLGPPLYSAAITLDKPIELTLLSQQIIGHTKAEQVNGRTYLRSEHPFLPSFGWVDEHTLLIAPEVTLQSLLSQKTPTKGLIADKLTATGSNDDLLAVVDLEALRPLIQMGLNQAAGEVPPEAQPFLEIPALLKAVHLRANLSGAGPWELLAQANSEADADRISALIDQAVQMYSDQMATLANEMLASDDPVEKAMGQYQLRTSSLWAGQMQPVRDGDQFTLFHFQPEGETAGLTSVAIIGVLVGLLLPAVQAAREAARRNASMNNMKQIMLALHNYHDANGNFPANANYTADGKPLLSWRVHILPYIEEGELYKQFHLDEPWDSEHNRQLISQMPELYVDPSAERSAAEGKTHYLGVKGEGFVFDGTQKGCNFAQIRDGTSNTIMVLQVSDQRAATWTQPDDWELDAKDTLKGLEGSMHPGTFLAGFADGHVRSISEGIDTEVFKHLLTIAGKEVVDQGDY